ncbi:MAG: HEAT repeat domain-containing protein, partial [Planctomycetes bacterium]|nr:HEAT repeat domain-containing protein [Planctomycetota bacterium]
DLRDKLAEALLTDPCFAVRVAALGGLGTVADPKSVPLLARALEKEILGSNGVLRAHLRRALVAIAGTDVGEAPESWTAWYDRNRAAIEDGTWKRGEDAGKTGGPDEKDSVAFYDIRTLSKRILLLVDASDTLIKPVDIELAKTKNFFEWNATAPKDRNYVSQYQLLTKETLKMVEALRGNAVFNILIMHGSSQLTPFSPQGMAPANEPAKKAVKPFLDKVVVGGWAPQIEGIWQAWRLAGGDPWGGDLPDEPPVDTVFLLSDGVPSGGQIVYGPALVDEVRRKHRFFRIPIHTIRIDDYKDTAQEFMEGVAAVTGGTAVWRTKP